jgi:asparagine synthase (glutamine-hydrolysing)
MSVVFGVVNWDGRPVAAGDLDRMDAALAAHGPDGHGLWRDGNAGLGHRLSQKTPEDRLERQPLSCADHGQLVADARIDNRDELSRAWPARPAEARDWPDSAFIARALETWGEDGAARLRGAFAFAHWDCRARRLLLARSPFCERPLFYVSSPDRFAFASMPKALFALGGVVRAVDEGFLADVLAGVHPDAERSYFRGVRRVPPGHALIVTASGARTIRFWRPESIGELRLPTDEAYVEAFLDVYGRAVRDAIRSAGPVGVMLSGGLDSTSLAALAAPLLAGRGDRLAAFTEVPAEGFAGPVVPHRYVDETPLVESLGRRYPNIDLSFIRTNGAFFLDGADARYAATEVPVRGALNLAWWHALLDNARGRGVTVMLGGFVGNATVSYNGASAIAYLIGHVRWRAAIREARAAGAAAGASTPRILAAQGIAPWLPAWCYRGLQRLRDPLGRAGHLQQRPAAINPSFAGPAVGARAASESSGDRSRLQPGSRAERSALLSRAPLATDGLMAGLQARFGIELRDPTADSRVVEFCLAVPEDQYRRGGEPRWLIRRAMAGRVPAEILDNRKRGLQAADWLSQLQAHQERMRIELDLAGQSDLVRRALDLPRLRRLVDALPSADAADFRVLADYRGVLDHGLDVARFILWVERG